MKALTDYINESVKVTESYDRLVKVDWCVDNESDLADLPEVVEVPFDMDDDDISDWLSDEYGFLVNAWYDA